MSKIAKQIIAALQDCQPGEQEAAIDDILNRYRKVSKKQKLVDELRASDLTAQAVGGRDDVEYGLHDSLPRGEHVANRRKVEK